MYMYILNMNYKVLQLMIQPTKSSCQFGNHGKLLHYPVVRRYMYVQAANWLVMKALARPFYIIERYLVSGKSTAGIWQTLYLGYKSQGACPWVKPAYTVFYI